MSDPTKNPDEFLPQGFTGTVNLKLTDLIQMVCLYHSSLLIRIKTSRATGMIHVVEGQIWHAETDSSRGDQAFFEILAWKDGNFEMLSYPNGGIQDRSIDKPWEHLLFEALRQQDESSGAASEMQDIVEGIDEAFDSLEGLVAEPEATAEPEAAIEPEAAVETNILIVDDSSFFARQLKRLLDVDPDINVVGSARNGKEAIELMASNPSVDLITLDIQMPVMSGDTALKHIMIRYPVPVLIVSALTSESMPKLFDFLQAGAVDFISKPGVGEDIETYGESLRNAAKRAARADVSRFKRWRKTKPGARAYPESSSASSRDKILVILGAEGAYMDWLRLPLPQLCSRGTVIGLQQLTCPFLDELCRLISTNTGVEVQPLGSDGVISPGRLFLGSATCRPKVRVVPGNLSLTFEAPSREAVSWKEGTVAWLEQLAEQAERKIGVCFLSGAQALPAEAIEKLLAHGVRLILAPLKSTMCTDLIDCARAYSDRYPNQVIQVQGENLLEIW